jgi:tRNA threonylcarbamoyladenosine biosynthesis protein TsaE
MKIQFDQISLQEIDIVLEPLIPLINKLQVVIFEGAMGSGKTTLIKAIAKRLGVIDNVSSPTYAIVNEYRTKEQKIIYHFDFYRINNLEEALDMGAEEYFYSGHLCFIEWAEKVESLLPRHYLKISIIYEDDKRKYSIDEI